MQEVDLAIAADGEATLPSLIEAVKRRDPGIASARSRQRGAKLAEASRAAAEALARRGVATRGTRAPSAPRGSCAEMWAQIKNEDWSLVSSYYSDAGGWPRSALGLRRSLSVARPRGRRRHRLRRAGFGRRRARQPRARPALGRDSDRRRPHVRAGRALDGRASRHSAPERDEQQPRVSPGAMHVQRMCNARNRGVDRGRLGSEITDPNIDYAKMAQRHGRATPKARSRIPRISAPRCGARSPSSSAASPRSSTS